MSSAGTTWLKYNAAENSQDGAAMNALIDANLRVTVNGYDAVGSAQDDDRAMRQLATWYPDYRREVVEVLDFGDRAVVRWRMVGTSQDAETPDLDVHGCSVIRAASGVISEAHLYYSGAALDAALEESRKHGEGNRA